MNPRKVMSYLVISASVVGASAADAGTTANVVGKRLQLISMEIRDGGIGEVGQVKENPLNAHCSGSQLRASIAFEDVVFKSAHESKIVFKPNSPCSTSFTALSIGVNENGRSTYMQIDAYNQAVQQEAAKAHNARIANGDHYSDALLNVLGRSWMTEGLLNEVNPECESLESSKGSLVVCTGRDSKFVFKAVR